MKQSIFYSSLFTVGLLAFSGCDKKADTVTVTVPAPTPVVLSKPPVTATNTLETKKLGVAVDAYISSPTEVSAADARKAFADLDGEIAELQSRVATTTGEDRAEAQGKLTNMQAYRAAEAARYNAANLTAPIVIGGPVDTRSGADKVGSTLEKVGDDVKDTAENIGDKIKDGMEKAGDKVKDATGN